MVMYARKQPRLSDGCHDRRESQPYQTLKYPSKSHPSSGDHRHDKMRDATDPSPPNKMLRRSNSPETKYGDGTGHSKQKTIHAHRVRERDGGTSYSPQENSHNHSVHSSNSHSSNPSSNPSKTSDAPYEPADDWSEHISSSGKKYYYNCRTEVSQWEKPKEWMEREQRQKEASKLAVINSFPKDRDYRREAMQATTTGGFSSGKSTSLEKSASHSCSTSSASSSSGLNPAATQSSSTSTVPVSPVPQSPIPPLLQDPNLLRQLLPALQATLQLNNSNVDMSKINEVLTAAVTQASLQSILHKILTAGPSAFNITTLLSQAAQLSTQAQPSNQSPMSLTSDASSPRSYVSPRISTPQTNTVPLKPMISTPPVSSQPKVSNPVVKQGPAPQPVPPVAVDKQHGHDAASPRSLQRSSSQRSPSPGSNHTPSSSASSTAAVPPNTSTRPPCSFTPTLAAHFNENLIKHVQGWPADHAEKQAARLREEAHNMGSIHMSEICTELKNLRSLVRVCEIQATLREQRILFLRQQIKELEKLKNQNSFMV
ncbi:WW domain-containing adapter protein with coiled-coil isoform X3 [Latimeria chalumnae]|uniref:WW domain-containing adapter protein with coiled-coil n=1 Tax=Latimeria chalumnae TaxID=7897 RepID=M3XHS5_LATCH|nr:PREDICTED: WW domain-containing adapter protein with coiled-coil isoform X3 [Latimeria chalumnae]|eukprot:XP_006009612.1 PREDICTED: WW domain-containing adapter protein with coiled-coil isoform X3 [Latimeria chalumnae]